MKKLDKENNAFERAAFLYNEWIVKPMPDDSKAIIKTYDNFGSYDAFKLATELQLAALNLLDGKNFQKPKTYSVALACFVIDHILIGFNASTKGYLRVAFTLSRPAIEASIFEIASALIPEIFQKKWNTPEGTGGHMIKELKKIKNFPSKTYTFIEQTWKSSAAFAHPSIFPLMSPQEIMQTEQTESIGISFAGQRCGKLNAQHLLHLFTTYTSASLIGVEATNIALMPLIEENSLWNEKYEELTSILSKPMPIPEHLKNIYNAFKQRNII